MPEITPITPEGTIQIQARTSRMYPGTPVETPENKSLIADPTPTEEPKSQIAGSDKEEKDKQVLRARLVQERMKQQLMAEKKQFEKEKQDFELQKANSRKWQEAAELASQGRFVEATEKTGVTYDQLTQQILNGGQIPPKQIAEQTAQELVKREMEAFRKEQAENQQKSVASQLDEARKIMFNDIKHLVDNSDKYVLAKQAESYQDIVGLIESEYHRTKRIISVEEAVQRWEKDALSGLEELLKLEPIRQIAQKEPLKPEASKVASPERQIPQTLSQRTMASVPKPQTLSDAERRKKAIDVYYGRNS